MVSCYAACPTHSPRLGCRAFSGQSLNSRLGCWLSVQVIVASFTRGAISQSGVESACIVSKFDVRRNISVRLLAGWVRGTVHPFNLQGRVERFRHRIVITSSGPADGLADLQSLQRPGELRRCIVATAVGMEDRADWQVPVAPPSVPPWRSEASCSWRPWP